MLQRISLKINFSPMGALKYLNLTDNSHHGFTPLLVFPEMFLPTLILYWELYSKEKKENHFFW